MTLIAEIKFVSTFALKPSNVTHMSGRTLLLPTPYAIKMALVDRAIVLYGFQKSKEIFPTIRDLNIYWLGPLSIGVMQVVESGYRRERSGTKPQIKIQEYCTYSDSFYMAFQNIESEFREDMMQFIKMLFYLGTSSSLVNTEFVHEDVDTFDNKWHNLCSSIDYSQVTRGIVQRMDDMRGEVSLEDVSRYNTDKRTDTRIQYDIVIPYKLVHASINFVGYERILL